MRRRSLFLRLFLGSLLLVLLMLGLALGFAYPAFSRFFQRESQARQQELTSVCTALVGQAWPQANTPAAMDKLCRSVLAGSPLRLTVIAADGQVLYDNLFDARQMDNHATVSRPELVDALAGRPGSATRRSETADEEFRYLAHPVVLDGRVVGAVRLAMPLTALHTDRDLLRHMLLTGGIIGLISAAVFSSVIALFWYLPLRKITLTARQIASGSLEQKARVTGFRELSRLAAALNDMRDGLASQIQTIAAQRGDLQTVISNLGEGIVALDANARVVLMNSTAGAMLGADASQAVGKPLPSVVRVPDVVDLSNQVFAQKQTLQRQSEADIRGLRRTLDIHVAPLNSTAGIAELLVLRDVTDLVRASAMKAEFAANASHELRTPLATLRAAVDNMEDMGAMDEAMSQRVHGILHRHVTRLENMTKDLLDLHLVETGKIKLRAEEIDVQKFRNWAVGIFGPKAEERNVALTVEAPAGAAVTGAAAADTGQATAASVAQATTAGAVQPGPATLPVAFQSDRKLLELILQNLLDNAIKFTPAGGHVSASLALRDDGRLVMRVSDTGCGIRKEDQTRVFERFFQADAARSGDTSIRGTGLGLAIVKHACEQLAGTIDLQSELGKGTTVTVVIPPLPPPKR